MTERPILFDGESVRGILAGTKTQTRRVVKPQPKKPVCGPGGEWWDEATGSAIVTRFQVGDQLWVRETWRQLYAAKSIGTVRYRADDGDLGHRWRPSFFMPRWASRITLEVVGVRVERVQAISEADAKAEGVERIGHGPYEVGGAKVHPMTSTYHHAFSRRWDGIIRRDRAPWASNPWVWVVEFARIKQ